jgi:hypothetical protein
VGIEPSTIASLGAALLLDDASKGLVRAGWPAAAMIVSW